MRPFIPQRRRAFLGCEGESERSYGALLGRLLESRCPNWHIHPVLLQPGGGDPLALIELALKRIAEEERKRETSYAIRAVLLDNDTLGRSPERDASMRRLAISARIRLIWQEPCHEALLLRHINGCHTLRPPTSALAMTNLLRHRPEYVKGSSAIRLAEWITETEIRRALIAELELAGFLADIGYE